MSLETDRAASTVIGVLLLVGVTVVVGGVLAVGALTFLDGAGAPQATAEFDYEQTSAGLRMTPQAISTTVTVQLNGRDVATFDPNSAGQSVLLPTAPGDRITVVSRDGEQSVLVDRTVDDRSEVGDFIAYYTFDAGSGTTLEDQSGNGNDGTLVGDSDGWTSNAYEFTGDDYFDVESLDAPPEDVTEFTIAVSYRQSGFSGDGYSQLVEHHNGGNEWFLETNTGTGSQYTLDYTVDYPNSKVTSDESYTNGERHVAVGTYDGSTYELFVDGKSEGSENFDSNVIIGDLVIGADAPNGGSQEFHGEIYEIRLYYRAFDESEVEVVTNAMD